MLRTGVGVGGLKSRSPEERFCWGKVSAKADVGAYLPPPCEGGARGGGGGAQSLGIVSVFARSPVMTIGNEHAAFVRPTLTGPPPLAPPSQGGEKRARSRTLLAFVGWAPPTVTGRGGSRVMV